jgi:opacity protein-like surface antigen
MGGLFDAPDELGLLRDPSTEFAVAGGYGRRFNRYVGGEAELLLASADYGFDLPADAAAASFDEVTLDTGAILVSIRASLPLAKATPYLTLGVGLFRSDLQNVDLGGFLETPTVTAVGDDDGTITQLAVGVEIDLGEKWALRLEWRDFEAKADFGTGVERDLGGPAALIGVRRNVGPGRLAGGS